MFRRLIQGMKNIVHEKHEKARKIHNINLVDQVLGSSRTCKTAPIFVSTNVGLRYANPVFRGFRGFRVFRGQKFCAQHQLFSF